MPKTILDSKNKKEFFDNIFKVFVEHYGLTCTCSEGVEIDFNQARGHYNRCAYWKFCHTVNRTMEWNENRFDSLRSALKKALDNRFREVQKYIDANDERNIGAMALWRDFKEDIDSVFDGLAESTDQSEATPNGGEIPSKPNKDCTLCFGKGYYHETKGDYLDDKIWCCKSPNSLHAQGSDDKVETLTTSASLSPKLCKSDSNPSREICTVCKEPRDGSCKG